MIISYCSVPCLISIARHWFFSMSTYQITMTSPFIHTSLWLLFLLQIIPGQETPCDHTIYIPLGKPVPQEQAVGTSLTFPRHTNLTPLTPLSLQKHHPRRRPWQKSLHLPIYQHLFHACTPLLTHSITLSFHLTTGLPLFFGPSISLTYTFFTNPSLFFISKTTSKYFFFTHATTPHHLICTMILISCHNAPSPLYKLWSPLSIHHILFICHYYTVIQRATFLT